MFSTHLQPIFQTIRHTALIIGFALILITLSGCGSAATSDPESETTDDTAAFATDADDTADASADLEEDNGAEAASTPVAPAAENGEIATVGPPEMYADGGAAALEPEARDDMYDAPPPMTIDPERYYYATLKTAQGDIRIQLFADRAPLTVNNFVFLANEGFYNDTAFHRVLDGFMAQAGDPTGTGSGGPGYAFEDEFHPGLQFDQAGLLAMANSGINTNGSQFFLTYGPADWLDFRHTIFGKVIEGEDVLARLSLRDPSHQPTTPGDTLYTVLIEEGEASVLPTPTPMPPTPTPTTTPTPFAPTALDLDARPLAELTPISRVNYFNQPPELVIQSDGQYTATIVTSQGDLTVALATDTHLQAVNNFIVLARLGYYDNTPISLVRPNDSIIFGVPDDNPLNDAGYKFSAEMGVGDDPEFGSIAYIPFEVLADGSTLSSSSQILIALIQPAPEFKSQLSFFGKIVEGQQILNDLSMQDTILAVRIDDADGEMRGPGAPPVDTDTDEDNVEEGSTEPTATPTANPTAEPSEESED
ncbi:MAG: peptidylprolyl isomerase [Litorilinea sp.]